MCERIENGSRAVFTDTLMRINKLPQKVWKPLIESGLEEIICRKILSGGELEEATDFCSICTRYEYNIIGTRLIGVLKARFPITDVADWSIVNNIGTKVAMSDEDLPGEIVTRIWGGGSGTYESELMKNVSSADKAFSKLKEITGIDDPRKYELDITSISREESEIPGLVTALYSSLECIVTEIPAITKDRRYKALSDLQPVFSTLSGYLKSKKTKWSRSDIRNEENPLLFCTVLMRKMSQALSRMGQDDLNELKKQKIIDAETVKDLKEFMKESDRICRVSYIETVDPEKRTKWIDAILKLEEQS